MCQGKKSCPCGCSGFPSRSHTNAMRMVAATANEGRRKAKGPKVAPMPAGLEYGTARAPKDHPGGRRKGKA